MMNKDVKLTLWARERSDGPEMYAYNSAPTTPTLAIFKTPYYVDEGFGTSNFHGRGCYPENVYETEVYLNQI